MLQLLQNGGAHNGNPPKNSSWGKGLQLQSEGCTKGMTIRCVTLRLSLGRVITFFGAVCGHVWTQISEATSSVSWIQGVNLSSMLCAHG